MWSGYSVIQCDQWYHAMCEVLSPQEEVSLQDIPSYKCLHCLGINGTLIDVYNMKISTLLHEEDDINARVVDAKIKCDNLKANYSKMTGDRESQLNIALESIKVIRQAYHGNVMVGNHCVIVLQKYSILTNVIADMDIAVKFNFVFDQFSKIMKLIMARRFLEINEISDLEDLTDQFGEIFPIYFPERNITRKIHKLIFNVPRFVNKHKTIGMLSEQEGESKHAAINAELRSLACVRNHAEQIRLVVEREELRSYMNKDLLKPKARMCGVCPRVFLRLGDDGKRHCQFCEAQFFKDK